MTTLWCEQCGEAEQEVHLADAGLCGDCFAEAFREQTKGFFWHTPCGHPHFNSKGQMMAVCVRECGSEHDHSDTRVLD
jgi:hypothetical protein